MKSVIRKIEKGINKFINLLSITASWIIALFMLLLFIQVVLRYLFNSPVYGLDELVTAMMIWSMSIGWCTVYWANEHAVIEAIMKKAPPLFKHFMYHVTNIIVLVTHAVFIPGGLLLFKMQNAMTPVGGLPFSKAWYYALPILFMGIIMVILSAFKTIGYVITGDDKMIAPVTEEEGGIIID